MQTTKDGGKFFISNASWEHRGRYTCTYQRFSLISEASEPVELTVIGKVKKRNRKGIPLEIHRAVFSEKELPSMKISACRCMEDEFG
ncbi:UNVERIFIED_CONTAM: hypothetical protein K2H54_038358 [Gekko kuhli]